MQQESTIDVRGSRSVGAAGGLVALAGFLIQAVATRPLDDGDLAQFLAFWAMAFGVIGVVGGVQHEVTRSVAARLKVGEGGGVRIVPLMLGLGAFGAVGVLLTSPLWAGSVVPRHTKLGVGLIAFAALALSGHAAIVGVLAGRREWRLYSRVAASESLVRLALIVVVLLTGARLVGFEVATAVATATWLLFLLGSAPVRDASKERGDVGMTQFLRRATHALVASTSTAVLVVGYPALIGMTSTRAEFVEASALMLALSLTRAPLLLPLNAFQGVAIHYFVHAGTRRPAALARLLGLVAATGFAGIISAYIIGPWLLQVITGRDLDAATLAILTLASTLLAVLTLTGTVTIASGLHRAYSTGWAVAALGSLALLFLPVDLYSRVLVSLSVGPVLGALVHLAALHTARTSPVPSP